jgi:hypothetical protein
MAGLRKILKMYGRMKVNGKTWLWDYATNQPRLKSEMTKAEINASEKAKWELTHNQNTLKK